MLTIKELKAILEPYGDDEDVVIRIRPTMDETEVGTITAERVKYVAVIYHALMPRANEKRK